MLILRIGMSLDLNFYLVSWSFKYFHSGGRNQYGHLSPNITDAGGTTHFATILISCSEESEEPVDSNDFRKLSIMGLLDLRVDAWALLVKSLFRWCVFHEAPARGAH